MEINIFNVELILQSREHKGTKSLIDIKQFRPMGEHEEGSLFTIESTGDSLPIVSTLQYCIDNITTIHEEAIDEGFEYSVNCSQLLVELVQLIQNTFNEYSDEDPGRAFDMCMSIEYTMGDSPDIVRWFYIDRDTELKDLENDIHGFLYYFMIWVF